jgi:hypothetical protein
MIHSTTLEKTIYSVFFSIVEKVAVYSVFSPPLYSVFVKNTPPAYSGFAL